MKCGIWRVWTAKCGMCVDVLCVERERGDVISMYMCFAFMY